MHKASEIYDAVDAGDVLRLALLLQDPRYIPSIDIRCTGRHYNPLECAIRKNHELIIDLLLDAGADINHSSELGGATPLILACVMHNVPLAFKLINLGADVNKCDHTDTSALSYASAHGLTEVVRVLCEKGADVNLSDNVGSPIFKASTQGNLEIIEILVDYGADVNSTSETTTCLMTACSCSRYDVAEYLIQHGADVNKTDRYGFSPLMYLASQGDMDIKRRLISLLVQNGAVINLKNPKNGQTARDMYDKYKVNELSEHLNALDK